MTAPPLPNAPLAARLRSSVDLRIPGFERTMRPGAVRQVALRQRDSIEWFEEFTERCLAAIGRTHFPVFRLSDGEFIFSVGFRFPYPKPGRNAVLHYARELVSYVRWRRWNTFLSGAAGDRSLYEEYSGEEMGQLRDRYVECLREIAEDGILATNLVLTPDRWALQFHRPVMAWLDRHRIPVTDENYYPFYFVYGLLNGPLRDRVYRGRRVLVVSRRSAERELAITAALSAFGAASVQYLSVSETSAMKDAIDLGGLAERPDLVLVGAGVGAANVLVQLRPLGTLCIDAGHCIDLLANPALAGQRDFTKSDDHL